MTAETSAINATEPGNREPLFAGDQSEIEVPPRPGHRRKAVTVANASAASRPCTWLGWCAALLLTVAAWAAPAGIGLAQLPQRWLDDDGRALLFDSLAGRRVVLTMAYAGCHAICPLAISRLQQIQRRLDARGEQAEFVVVGYDPENERPTDWHAYRASHHLDRGNWHFLSGSRDDTERLARELGFDFWKYDEHVMHGLRALIFDTRGRLQLELGPETRDWASAI